MRWRSAWATISAWLGRDVDCDWVVVGLQPCSSSKVTAEPLLRAVSSKGTFNSNVPCWLLSGWPTRPVDASGVVMASLSDSRGTMRTPYTARALVATAAARGTSGTSGITPLPAAGSTKVVNAPPSVALSCATAMIPGGMIGWFTITIHDSRVVCTPSGGTSGWRYIAAAMRYEGIDDLRPRGLRAAPQAIAHCSTGDHRSSGDDRGRRCRGFSQPGSPPSWFLEMPVRVDNIVYPSGRGPTSWGVSLRLPDATSICHFRPVTGVGAEVSPMVSIALGNQQKPLPH